MASSTPTPPAPAPQLALDPEPPRPPGADAGDFDRAPGSEPDSQSQTADPAPEVALPAGIFAAVVKIPFRRWGQPLEEYEAEALSEAMAAVLNKYLPTGSGRYSEEMQLALVLVMVLQPRIQGNEAERAGKEESNRPASRPERQRKDLQGEIAGGYRPAGTDH